MILQEGKTQEELMQVLQEMDDLTSMDSLVRNEQKVNIECERENGRLKNWRLIYSPEFKRKPISMGTTYNRFFSALDKMQKEEVAFDSPNFTILCYLSTAPHKDWNGNILSYWTEIEPGTPYQVIDGELKFKTKEVVMSESDFAVLSKTGLAFYCKSNDMYYPFTETAYLSIGRLLSSAAAFRDVDAHLLGTALLMAEKISCFPELRIITRSKNDRIRPILSVVGRRYNLFSQKLFFETILKYAATKLGVYEVSSWIVEDEITRLTLEYSNAWEEYYFKVTFSTGDIPLTPFGADLEVVYKNAVIPLVSNKARHTEQFTVDSIPELLCNMSEKMDEFSDCFHYMQQKTCYFESTWLNDIHAALGKKRTAELTPIPSGTYSAMELWDLIVATRYMQIPERQTIDLKNGFFDLFFKIVDHLDAGQATA